MACSKTQSILMANNNCMEGFVSNKKPKLYASDYETIRHSRPLVSIDYIRVRGRVRDRDRDRDRIENREREFNGTVIVRDCCGEDIAYLEHMGGSGAWGGEYISLTGPSRPICGAHKFVISLYLWDKDCENFPMTHKEMGKGEIVWDPNARDHSSYDKPLQQDVSGKYGHVTVGYSVLRHALRATLKVVMASKSPAPAQIYGTIEASTTFLGRPWMLFDSSRVGSLYLYQQENILPLRCPFFAVPLDSYLTIAVHLWDEDDNQIALGSLEFTPIFGTQQKNIISCNGNFGDIQVSITWE